MPPSGYEQPDNRFLEQLPHTALQAIYHAVTGKTENLSKRLKKNVIIDHVNFDQLYHKLKQQAEHYNIISGITTTIVLKQADYRSFQYSSWERFREVQTGPSDITSEISLKLEFILQLPNTPGPQRFIISVGLDSGLPLMASQRGRALGDSYFIFGAFGTDGFPTVDISIDFVDFLIARIFAGIVEEWFNSLEEITIPKFAKFLTRKMWLLHSITGEFGRLGCAIFLSSFVWFSKGNVRNLGELMSAAAIAVFGWSLLSILGRFINSGISRRVFRSIVPSVILLTENDRNAWDKVKSDNDNFPWAMLSFLLGSIVTISLNVLSSYIYANFFASGGLGRN